MCGWVSLHPPQSKEEKLSEQPSQLPIPPELVARMMNACIGAMEGMAQMGRMMGGMGMEDEERESRQSGTEAREPVRKGGDSPQAPTAPARTRQEALVGRENGHPEER